MNRRDLFKNAALLAGASVAAPELLADALPRENAYATYGVTGQIPLGELINVNVVLSPLPWPTHEEILAELAREYRNAFADADLSPETADFQMLSVFAGAVFANQETVRAMLTSCVPVATGV
jgi:hypothetical protein